MVNLNFSLGCNRMSDCFPLLRLPTDVLINHVIFSIRSNLTFRDLRRWWCVPGGIEEQRVALTLSHTCRRLRALYDSQPIIWYIFERTPQLYLSARFLASPCLVFHLEWFRQNHLYGRKEHLRAQLSEIIAQHACLVMLERYYCGPWTGRAIEILVARNDRGIADWIWKTTLTSRCRSSAWLCNLAVRMRAPACLVVFLMRDWRGNTPPDQNYEIKPSILLGR
jgi:hypothetical protein